jgi:hypothetical protein
VNIKTILFIDKKWQSSVTAYVRVHDESGSLRHYLQGRYGGSALTESDYDEAKPTGLAHRSVIGICLKSKAWKLRSQDSTSSTLWGQSK